MSAPDFDDKHDVAWDVAEAFIFRLLWRDQEIRWVGSLGAGWILMATGFVQLGVVEGGSCCAGCGGTQGEGVVDDLQAFVFGHCGCILLVKKFNKG